MNVAKLFVVLALVASLTACPKSGPKTVVRDRFDYNTAVGESMKDQMLLNVVKLRYLDMPVFLDVAQIINSYEFQASVSAGGSIVNQGGTDTLNLGAGGSYANRPTITYTPLTGNQYVRGLMTPLPPEVVFFTVESGYSAELIIRATVSSINGLRNDTISDGEYSQGDAAFLRAARLFRVLQRSGAISLIVKIKPDKERVPFLILDAANLGPATQQAVSELKSLLGLDPNGREFRIQFGSHAEGNTEIALQTRSLFQVMGGLAAQIEVPRDAKEAAAAKGLGQVTTARIFRVHSSTKRPANAYAVVRYRDHWYWIDDADADSKRLFVMLMLLFSFGDTKGGENLPVLTIPVN